MWCAQSGRKGHLSGARVSQHEVSLGVTSHRRVRGRFRFLGGDHVFWPDALGQLPEAAGRRRPFMVLSTRCLNHDRHLIDSVRRTQPRNKLKATERPLSPRLVRCHPENPVSRSSDCSLACASRVGSRSWTAHRTENSSTRRKAFSTLIRSVGASSEMWRRYSLQQQATVSQASASTRGRGPAFVQNTAPSPPW